MSDKPLNLNVESKETGKRSEAESPAAVKRKWKMPDHGRLAARYEAFCQYMATGEHSNAECARLAGYASKSSYGQGWELAKRPYIQDRIKEIQRVKQDADRARRAALTYTLADALREAEECRLLALEKKNPAALATATRLKADLVGLLVQKVSTEATVRTIHDGVDELGKAIQAALDDPNVRKLLAGPAKPLN